MTAMRQEVEQTLLISKDPLDQALARSFSLDPKDRPHADVFVALLFYRFYT